jgi:hypothetical protein
MALWIASASLAPTSGAAQSDPSYMIHMLQSSTSFRVRTSAAQRLGDAAPSAAVTQALIAALRDSEDSVRAAAASSLGRVGDTSALSALRALSSDSAPAVRTAATAAIAAIGSRGTGGGGTGTGTGTGTTAPSGPARFYIGVGDAGSTVAGLDRALLGAARTTVVSGITPMSGVVVAPAGETAAQARTAIAAQHLRGFYLDISITDLTTRPDGAIHASVSIVVQDYPSHNIRSMLSGAATASGVSGVSGQRAVLQAALQGALRSLNQALGP